MQCDPFNHRYQVQNWFWSSSNCFQHSYISKIISRGKEGPNPFWTCYSWIEWSYLWYIKRVFSWLAFNFRGNESFTSFPNNIIHENGNHKILPKSLQGQSYRVGSVKYTRQHLLNDPLRRQISSKGFNVNLKLMHYSA